VKQHVLVVEDDADAREILVAVLEGLGYRVTAREDGRAAMAAEAPFDAAILDLQMPHVDGIELIRRLRRQPATRDLPILCLSARADQRSREGALAAGCNRYLTKPLPPDQIVQALLALLDGPRPEERAG
jgi:CheY-like chemotaxis protein